MNTRSVFIFVWNCVLRALTAAHSLGVPEILGPTCEQIIGKQSLVPLESLGFVVYHTENPHSHHLGDFFYKSLNTGGLYK